MRKGVSHRLGVEVVAVTAAENEEVPAFERDAGGGDADGLEHLLGDAVAKAHGLQTAVVAVAHPHVEHGVGLVLGEVGVGGGTLRSGGEKGGIGCGELLG